MATQIETGEREIVLVEDAHIRPMMGLDILEPLPSRTIPYAQVDPFILVHEAVVPITEERASRSQIAVLGAGRALRVVDAQPGTRFMLMAGKPYGEMPVFNGPYVD
jgi:redox-sensitive bicupin YhaK (pirin superfamily)